MSKLRSFIKDTLPEPLLQKARAFNDSLAHLKAWPVAAFHPWRRDTINQLRTLKDSHQGQRCFIMGNGPSLAKTDLSKLKNEFTFGMNRIYLAFPEMGFKTSYYLSVNDLVIEQCAEDIQKLSMPRFVSWRSRKWLSPQDNLFFLHTTYTGPRFTKDLTKRLWESATVTYVALQAAYYLGFSTVILIGVDHNFETKGKPNTTIVSQGDDPNHFLPHYFGKGFRWQLPDLETSELGYRMAKEAFESAGRQVLDATIGGKLTIFPKIDYESLFD